MLRWRLILGPILIAALLGICTLDARAGSPAPWLWGLAVLLVLRGTWEMQRLLRVRSFEMNFKLVAGLAVLVLTANWIPQWWPAMAGSRVPGTLGVALLVYTVGVLVLFANAALRYRAPGGNLETLGAEVLTLTYIGFFTGLTAQLRWVSPEGTSVPGSLNYLPLGSLIVATKCGDICAYFAGHAFGRKKLIPTLSPGKTWAGAYGALLGAALGNWAWLHWGTRWLTAAQPGHFGWALGAGAVLGVVGLLGDLCESLIKRDVGQKDSAPLLPGFGGLLDLLDSVIYTGPVAYMLWLWWPLVR